MDKPLAIVHCTTYLLQYLFCHFRFVETNERYWDELIAWRDFVPTFMRNKCWWSMVMQNWNCPIVLKIVFLFQFFLILKVNQRRLRVLPWSEVMTEKRLSKAILLREPPQKARPWSDWSTFTKVKTALMWIQKGWVNKYNIILLGIISTRSRQRNTNKNWFANRVNWQMFRLKIWHFPPGEQCANFFQKYQLTTEISVNLPELQITFHKWTNICQREDKYAHLPRANACKSEFWVHSLLFCALFAVWCGLVW